MNSSIILGNINKDKYSINIVDCPHLLIAGSTGSGKSVLLNNIISQLISNNDSSNMKIAIIDIKRVEFSQYNGIKQLSMPIAKDIASAIDLLNHIISIMEDRYRFILEPIGYKNIDEYNIKAKLKLPKIFLIIDELADLMILGKKRVDEPITRLTQLARASGIHLIIATQKPDKKIITPLIKANIPTRISMRLPNIADYYTILGRHINNDTLGLLLNGKGSMLLIDDRTNKPIYIKGDYISDSDIKKIVAKCK